ncbi:hypothetical protein [Phenylobacterium sp.]|uniref:terminase small subunit-like protein n=1 Tax=Phenylobacterium sp. TaxID=1871053 RepID=UPI002734B56A|nr:hypothetical protein [Phenylobacterium sp.]MDP3591304.1 hypothetical protein [Phenylobacterium sp.]
MPSSADKPWVPPRQRSVPPMDHAGGGGGSQYRPEFGEVICARIDAGETLNAICADPAMPCRATLRRWRKMHPEFAAMYERVRRHLAEGKIQNRRLKHVSDAWRVPHEIKLGLRKPHLGGKKSTYQRAWSAAFCERVAAGETITAITADPAMPSVKAVYAWLKRHEEFLDMYLEARAEQKRWLEFNIDMVVMEATPATFRSAKAEVARLEGLIGRLTAKTYRP